MVKFMCASAADHLSTICFVKAPNMWKSQTAESVTGYGAVARWLWITVSTVLILQLVISILWTPQKAPAWSAIYERC